MHACMLYFCFLEPLGFKLMSLFFFCFGENLNTFRFQPKLQGMIWDTLQQRQQDVLHLDVDALWLKPPDHRLKVPSF